MGLKVGQIPYLNCEPFYRGLAGDGIALCPMVPSAMGQAAQDGLLDAGPFSLSHVFEFGQNFEPMGNMGIAVKGRVQSVILHSKVPIEELSGATIGITHETATAVNLLKVLLQRRYLLDALKYTELQSPRLDAFLLIGDQSLRNGGVDARYPYCFDLASEWFEWQGLSFVFAVWMIRRSLEPDVKAELTFKIRARLAENLSQNLVAIADARTDIGMDRSEIVSYLKTFRYVLAAEEWKAVDVFKDACEALALAQESVV